MTATQATHSVQCPSCESWFPIAPERVPEEGVAAICSHCLRVFRVERPVEGEGEAAAEEEWEAAGALDAPDTAEVAGGEDWAEDPVADTGFEVEVEPVQPESSSLDDEFEVDEGATDVAEAPADASDEVIGEATGADELEVANELEVADGTATDRETEFDEEFQVPEETAIEDGTEEGIPEETATEDGTEVEVADELEVDDETAIDEETATEEETTTDEETATDEETVIDEGTELDLDPELDDQLEPTGTPVDLDEEDAAIEPEAGPMPEVEETGGLETERVADPARTDEASPVREQSLSRAAARFGRRDPHDRAKRLARVLVSDMLTYHPARYEEALAEGTLKEHFEDEIRLSWEEYEEQIGSELAESTDYFIQALNEILARGERLFRGIGRPE